MWSKKIYLAASDAADYVVTHNCAVDKQVSSLGLQPALPFAWPWERGVEKGQGLGSQRTLQPCSLLLPTLPSPTTQVKTSCPAE